MGVCGKVCVWGGECGTHSNQSLFLGPKRPIPTGSPPMVRPAGSYCSDSIPTVRFSDLAGHIN